MIEALIGLGIGALLAHRALIPLEGYLERRQDRFDQQRAEELAAHIRRRAHMEGKLAALEDAARARAPHSEVPDLR